MTERCVRLKLDWNRVPVEGFVDFLCDDPLKDFKLKIRRRRVQMYGRLAVMTAVDDSRMYQKVQFDPNGSLKL